MYHKVSDRPLVAMDVDDTIIKWNVDYSKPTVKITLDGITGNFNVHKKHVEALKKHKIRGHTIIIWSAGGSDWGEAVVKALQLEQYVDIIMPKPDWIYDDVSPNEFLNKNLYIYEGDEE